MIPFNLIPRSIREPWTRSGDEKMDMDLARSVARETPLSDDEAYRIVTLCRNMNPENVRPSKALLLWCCEGLAQAGLCVGVGIYRLIQHGDGSYVNPWREVR